MEILAILNFVFDGFTSFLNFKSENPKPFEKMISFLYDIDNDRPGISFFWRNFVINLITLSFSFKKRFFSCAKRFEQNKNRNINL